MENKLSSTDIYLAAALMSLGAKLVDVNREEPRHMIFSLEMDGFESSILNQTDAHLLSNLEKEYANEQLMVNAVKYKDAIQRLKSVVHSK